MYLYIKAESGKEAASKARLNPRVKHDHKDAILEVTKISFEDYRDGNKENSMNPYFLCSNVQEQRKHPEIYACLIEDHHCNDIKFNNRAYGKKSNRNKYASRHSSRSSGEEFYSYQI